MPKKLYKKSEFEIIIETRSLINDSLVLLHQLEQEFVYLKSKQKTFELYERSVDCDCSYLTAEIKQHELNINRFKLEYASKIQEAKRFSIDNIINL